MAPVTKTKIAKPPSTASSSDSEASDSPRMTPAPLLPQVDITESMPPTPGGPGNPFGTPAASIMTGGDVTPALSPSSRVTSFTYQHGYFPGDITSRASGILSVHASTTEIGISHARNASAVSTGTGQNPFSSGRSNISGLSNGSSGDISEIPRRPGLPNRTSTAIREAFQSPPPRAMTFYGSTPGSTINVSGTPSRAPAKRQKSSMLTGEIDKPWMKKKDTVARVAYWLTYGVAFLGIVASAIRCYFGYLSVPKFTHPLCPVLDDDFSTFNTDVWSYETQLDGFGNGEFEMTTDSSNNTFIRNNQLYLMPTLTSDVIGRDAIFNGHTYNLTDCTGLNYTACGAVSNLTTSTVIPPVMSSRISTRKSRSIRFGRVEVVAKLPRGDWLWPAIWMLPVNNVYGQWPLSGEIDIMESRGNAPTYPKQGRNYVRGSLNWGPTSWLNAVYKTYGWWTMRRASYDQAFHTYALEWTEDWMRIYVDSRLHHMLDLSFNKPFWQRGDFPDVVTNGSNTIALQDPWTHNATVPNAAPFDQEFYLIMNVAVGGTNGWFPDNAGGKPWIDDSKTAMSDFAKAQDTWFSTWPQGNDIDDRAMIIDSVKMWAEC